MNKKELVLQVAQQAGFAVVDAEKCVEAVLHSIKEAVVAGDVISLKGFGSFSVAHRAERQGINPSTKQPITIPARKVVKFTASKKIEL